MRHTRAQTPAYLIWVDHRPSSRGAGKATYFDAVKTAAAAEIKTPITADDIDVEIVYGTVRKHDERLDADNVNKPTLDALKGIAYRDDRQVRSVSSTVFDRKATNTVHGRVEHMGRLFYSPHPDVALIMIYSDARLSELGGEEEVQRRRYEAWQRDFEQTLAHIRENPA
jgi:Holliday junction resolvase RusA-like endonuclease